MSGLALPVTFNPPLADGEGVLIGRCYRGKPDSIMPYYRCNPYPALDYGEIACMQLSYVVSRADCNDHIYEICHVPRARAEHTKQSELLLLGKVLATICAGNNDEPPIAASQDFHGSHLWIVMAFLGLVNRSFLTNVPFFNECSYFKLYQIIPNFNYCVLLYKDIKPMFNQGDAIMCSMMQACACTALHERCVCFVRCFGMCWLSTSCIGHPMPSSYPLLATTPTP